MIDIETLENNIKKNIIENCYIFCGIDEKLIKESVNNIINSVIDDGFLDLNLIKFSGSNVTFDDILNACETLPFMSDKKVVLVYRAEFLKDKGDKEGTKKFEELQKYVDNVPKHCILILYYLFEEEREKPSNRVKKLEKKCCLVKSDKLKGERLYKKVNNLFLEKNREIGKIELKFFCDNIDNNMDIIENEVEKLTYYTEGRSITKEDISKLSPQKSDNDIFDLVDFLSQKKPEKALDILNELVFRGENILGILSMIERQFKLLLSIKFSVNEGKNKDIIAKELRLPPFIAEKLMFQSKKFTLKQLKTCLELCLNTERILKTSGNDKKTEMELLIINTVRM